MFNIEEVQSKLGENFILIESNKICITNEILSVMLIIVTITVTALMFVSFLGLIKKFSRFKKVFRFIDFAIIIFLVMFLGLVLSCTLTSKEVNVYKVVYIGKESEFDIDENLFKVYSENGRILEIIER